MKKRLILLIYLLGIISISFFATSLPSPTPSPSPTSSPSPEITASPSPTITPTSPAETTSPSPTTTSTVPATTSTTTGSQPPQTILCSGQYTLSETYSVTLNDNKIDYKDEESIKKVKEATSSLVMRATSSDDWLKFAACKVPSTWASTCPQDKCLTIFSGIGGLKITPLPLNENNKDRTLTKGNDILRLFFYWWELPGKPPNPYTYDFDNNGHLSDEEFKKWEEDTKNMPINS